MKFYETKKVTMPNKKKKKIRDVRNNFTIQKIS